MNSYKTIKKKKHYFQQLSTQNNLNKLGLICAKVVMLEVAFEVLVKVRSRNCNQF